MSEQITFIDFRGTRLGLTPKATKKKKKGRKRWSECRSTLRQSGDYG